MRRTMSELQRTLRAHGVPWQDWAQECELAKLDGRKWPDVADLIRRYGNPQELVSVDAIIAAVEGEDDSDNPQIQPLWGNVGASPEMFAIWREILTELRRKLRHHNAAKRAGLVEEGYQLSEDKKSYLRISHYEEVVAILEGS